jgi:hypothetical protein
MVVIGEVRCPGRHGRALWHRVRHSGRKVASAWMATGWTDFDLGAMCRDFQADSRNIEHLALFITRHLDAHQGRLTTRALLHPVPFYAVWSVRGAQGVALMAGLAAIGLLPRLP